MPNPFQWPLLPAAGSFKPTQGPRVADSPALGVDIKCLSSIGKVFGLSKGRLNLALAIARRFMSPRGSLFYDQNYGYSLCMLLSGELTLAGVLGQGPAIESEALKDERVLAASCIIRAQDYDPVDRKLVLNLFLTDAQGPFKLVLAASAVTVEVLSVDNG